MIEKKCDAFESEIKQILMDQYAMMIDIAHLMERALAHRSRIVVLGVGYNHQMAEEFVGRLGWIEQIEAVLWPEFMVHENNRFENINQCATYSEVILKQLSLQRKDILILVADEITPLILSCIHGAQRNEIKVVLISQDSKFQNIVAYNLVSQTHNDLHPSIMQCFLAQCLNCLLANQLSKKPKDNQVCLQEYALKVVDIIIKIRRKQKDKIMKAKEMMQISKHTYIIGAGHSHMSSEMMFYDQAKNQVIPILEEELLLLKDLNKSNRIESILDYGRIIVDKYGIGADDVLIVVSNSGKSKMIVELCKEAKEKGAQIIAITNVSQIPFVTSNHPSGKKLYEFANLVIDNCGYQRDACMQFDDVWRCPTSSYISMFIVSLLSN